MIRGLMALPTCLSASWQVSSVGRHNRRYSRRVLFGIYVDNHHTTAAGFSVTRKEVKYVELSTTRHFVPLTFETLDPISSSAMTFLKEIGHHLTLATDTSMETAHLFQRLSIALQRF